MNRYRVELEIQTTGRPDETFTATVDAEDSEVALATAKVMALRNGCRGRVTLATCHRIEDDETTVDDPDFPGSIEGKRWTDGDPRPLDTLAEGQRALAAERVASLRYPREPEATMLSDAQASTLSAMAKSLAPGSGVRLALDLALATDRAQKIPAPKEHDFGSFGDMAFCKRSGCQAPNTRPANRWGCKGAA